MLFVLAPNGVDWKVSCDILANISFYPLFLGHPMDPQLAFLHGSKKEWRSPVGAQLWTEISLRIRGMNRMKKFTDQPREISGRGSGSSRYWDGFGCRDVIKRRENDYSVYCGFFLGCRTDRSQRTREHVIIA
jgi:hypothetical protein